MRRILGILCLLLAVAAITRSRGLHPPMEPQRTCPVRAQYPQYTSVQGLIERTDDGPARKVVHTSRLELRVRGVTRCRRQIGEEVSRLGGFVSQSSLDQGELPRATIVARVPQGQREALMLGLTSLGQELSRGETAEDATEAYLDEEARLRNLQSEEFRLQELLKLAKNVKDLLEVDREMSRVRGEIEQLQGHLKRVDYQVAYATLEVSLTEAPQEEATAADFWDLSRTVTQAWGYARQLARAGLKALIYGVFALPFVLGLGLLGVLGRKHRLRV